MARKPGDLRVGDEAIFQETKDCSKQITSLFLLAKTEQGIGNRFQYLIRIASHRRILLPVLLAMTSYACVRPYGGARLEEVIPFKQPVMARKPVGLRVGDEAISWKTKDRSKQITSLFILAKKDKIKNKRQARKPADEETKEPTEQPCAGSAKTAENILR